MNTTNIQGYDGFLYDISKDILLAGFYKTRVIRRSKDGFFWIKKEGKREQIPEFRIKVAVSKKINRDKMASDDYETKNVLYKKKSDDKFLAEHGFNRSAFCKWLLKEYNRANTPYRNMSDIPAEVLPEYFELYRSVANGV